MLSGCSDGSIYFHDLNNFTGKPNHTASCICKVPKTNPNAHKYSVECATWYGNDNGLFITSGTDKLLKVWDSNCLTPVEKFNSKGRIFHHQCSPIPSSNPLISVASSVNHVEIIDLRSGGSTQELRGHSSSILTCCWSPVDEYLLATGGIDNNIFFWDIRSGNSVLKRLDQYNANTESGTAHTGYVNSLQFTSDGLLLVSFGTDNRLRLWETLNGHNQMINYGKIKNDVKKSVQFAISNNSKPSLIYVPSCGNIYILELLSGQRVGQLYGHFNSVNCCFYRDIYQELYSGGNDRNVLTWTSDSYQTEDSDEKYEGSSRRNPMIRTLDNWSSDED